jgi:hypothetical protein
LNIDFVTRLENMLERGGEGTGKKGNSYKLKINFPAIFVLLTSSRDWIYHFFVMGSIDSTLNGSVSRAERKSKSLSLKWRLEHNNREWLWNRG